MSLLNIEKPPARKINMPFRWIVSYTKLLYQLQRLFIVGKHVSKAYISTSCDPYWGWGNWHGRLCLHHLKSYITFYWLSEIYKQMFGHAQW